MTGYERDIARDLKGIRTQLERIADATELLALHAYYGRATGARRERDSLAHRISEREAVRDSRGRRS